MATQLAKLTDAVRLLAEAQTLEDFLSIHNMAALAEEYAKAEQMGAEAEGYAREIRLRAARKAGEVLLQMKDAGERRPIGVSNGGGRKVTRADLTPTLADLGVTKNKAARWQRMATVPAPEFEQKLTEGWGEEAIASGARHTKKSPKTKTNGYTEKQSLSGLQNAAIQLESLAEGLDGGLFGDWPRLHDNPEAQRWFQILESSLPIVSARVKRALRQWKEQAA
jgi:hypothetical protein